MIKISQILLLAALLVGGLACSSSTDSEPCTSAPAAIQASLTSNYHFGNLQTEFKLDASGSRDTACGDRVLYYRWDTDGDGLYDTAKSSNPRLDLSFASVGLRPVKVEVSDSSQPAAKATAEAAVLIEVVDREYATITTWCGTGIAGATGENVPLLETELFTPQDMSIGPDGTAYILNWNAHRVLRVNGARTETICGTGTLGDAPEGTATTSGLNHPTSITVDPQGRLVMAAWHNSMIMRIDPSLDSLVRLAGRRPLNGTNSNRCYDSNDEGGSAVESCLDLPVSTAFDSQGRLYISDQKNVRIARVDPVGGVITDHEESGTQSTMRTIAGIPGDVGFNGNGLDALATKFSAPGGQSADPTSRIVIRDDVLYIADSENHQIRSIDLTLPNPTVELVAGRIVGGAPQASYNGDGGPADQAALRKPVDIAFDSIGNLFIADTFNHAIRRVDAVTGIITTVVGKGFGDPCAETQTYPCDLDLTDGEVLGDGGDPLEAYLSRPYGIEIDANDNLYIVDTYHHRIRLVRK